MQLRVGDVYDYTPMDANGKTEHHCREGQATVERFSSGLFLLDTFWGRGGDRHQLTMAELATAEFSFNEHDYDELDGRGEAQMETWKTYSPDDRGRITSQHGLQSRWLIRKGAKPDLATQIGNARAEVEAAEGNVRSAEFRLKMRRDDLAALLDAPASVGGSV